MVSKESVMTEIACASPPASARPVILGWLAGLSSVSIWAVWAVATRHAVTHDLPPAAIGLFRFGVPALILLPFTWRIGLFPKGLGLLKGLALLGSGAPSFLIVALGMQFARRPRSAPSCPAPCRSSSP